MPIEYTVNQAINILEEPNFGERKAYLRHQNTLLFHGDTLNEQLFDKEFIDIIVTSPPYNVSITNKKDWAVEIIHCPI